MNIFLNRLAYQYFVNEVKKEIGRDVVLFGLDGMSYFGNLQAAGNNGVAILVPATLSSSGLIEIRNPAKIFAAKNWTFVDLSLIVAMGSVISADPFVLPCTEKEGLQRSNVKATKPGNSNRHNPYNNYDSQESFDLVYRLKHQIGDVVSIITLGGFMFAGELAFVDNDTARLTAEYIFTPGSDGNTLLNINTILVNLKAMNSVSS